MMLEEVKKKKNTKENLSVKKKSKFLSQQNVTKDDVGRQMREKNISEDT